MFFRYQVLAQLDLLRCWKETTTYKNIAHLFPRLLHEKVARLHLPALGAVLDVHTQEHIFCALSS